MIDTKLILIEGIPGSGKSTTAINLANAISICGIKCQCYLEWAEDNPIFIGFMENLPEIISLSKLHGLDILQQWQNFTQKAKRQVTVNIIESRFWQNDAMYLYLSGHSEDEVIESNKRVLSVISELNPVLIYLDPENIAQMLIWTTQVKNKNG
jgi:thymidylate kinase